MYKQAADKEQFMDRLSAFQNKMFDEEANISHRIVGPNFDEKMKPVFPLFCAVFESEDVDLVSNSINAFDFTYPIAFYFAVSNAAGV